MSPPEDLYPPVGSSPGWTVVAVVVLAAVVLWWVALWWWTRPSPAPARWSPLRGRALARHRAASLAAVDAVLAAHEAGRLDTRAAFQQLSPIVRRFVYDAAGLPAHTMGLDELTVAQPGVVADVVALMYPVEFAAASDGDVAVGADWARRAIASWSPDRPAGRLAVGAGAAVRR